MVIIKLTYDELKEILVLLEDSSSINRKSIQNHIDSKSIVLPDIMLQSIIIQDTLNLLMNKIYNKIINLLVTDKKKKYRFKFSNAEQSLLLLLLHNSSISDYPNPSGAVTTYTFAILESLKQSFSKNLMACRYYGFDRLQIPN